MNKKESELLELLNLIVGHARVGLISNELGKQVKLEQIIRIASAHQKVECEAWNMQS